MPSQLFIVVLALCLVFFFPAPAQAYLDPGTGSLILQVIVAGFLGALLTIKLWYAAAKHFFSRIFGGKKDVDSSQPPETAKPPAETGKSDQE